MHLEDEVFRPATGKETTPNLGLGSLFFVVVPDLAKIVIDKHFFHEISEQKTIRAICQ